jgi:hypothetical protein
MKTVLPAQDLYLGTNRVVKADGTLENTATVANGSITAAKLAANSVETAKIKDAHVTAAKLATDAVETAKIKAKSVTLAKLADTARTNILTYQVEDLAANADIADRVIFEVPEGLAIKVLTAKIIPHGSAVGIDDSSTCVIKLSDGTNTLVEKTYDLDPAFPAASEAASLGAIDTDHDDLAAGGKLYLSVTNGTTANPPAFMLIVTYTVADAT